MLHLQLSEGLAADRGPTCQLSPSRISAPCRASPTRAWARASRPVRAVTTAPRGTRGRAFRSAARLPASTSAALDPFIHMDQMGEVEYAPGEPKGTAWHPHRGFETVTYMIDGEMRHQDSTGGGGLITNGDTQWMTAGSGLLHIEAPPEHLVTSGGLFHGVQLWVNLPSARKMIDPRYQDIRARRGRAACPRPTAGPAAGHRRRGRRASPGPGSTNTPITLVHATLAPGARACGCRGTRATTPSRTACRARVRRLGRARSGAGAGGDRPARGAWGRATSSSLGADEVQDGGTRRGSTS